VHEPVSDFVVLLVGGASGSGKTMLARPLARALGVNLTEVDDIQLALEAATTERELPLLHFWRTHVEEFGAWSDDRRVTYFVRVCREVFSPVMRAIITDHLSTGVRVVYEGDFLLPEMAALAMYGDQPNAGRVRALVVSEPDEDQIAENYRIREGGAAAERSRTSSLFDAFLRVECVHYGVPLVNARPWPSGVERAVAALR
jgi:2-phosphoglycerate kinase